MNDRISIDFRFMTGAYLKQYKSISSVLSESYRSVVEQVSTKFDLEYVPTVYVIPFVVQRDSMSPGTSKPPKITYFNLTAFDTDDPSHLAIYSSIEFLKKFPKYIRAGLGHELAHVIVEKETVREFPTQDLDVFFDPTQVEATKEVRKDEIVEMFPEPIRRDIEEWDKLSHNAQTMLLLCRGGFVVDFSVFDNEVFDGRFDELTARLAKR